MAVATGDVWETTSSQQVNDLWFRSRSTPDGMSARSEVYTIDDRKLVGRKVFKGETAHMDAERYTADQIVKEMYGR